MYIGCQVLTIDGGHISSYLMGRSIIIQAQSENMDRVLCSEGTAAGLSHHNTPIVTSPATDVNIK